MGRYELLLPIARGGMGAVYLARTHGMEGFERACALKIVDRALEPELARDLVEEAKLAARIHHRNVVGVLDVGVESDTAYLAMEYIEGPSLASLLKAVNTADGVLPLGVGMRILVDLLEGLHAAHELRDASGKSFNVVHRDVSPANVLVGVDGVAKLTDFGIARAVTRSSNTSTGVVKGKFSYMSPEQARGAALDRRADIWSSGVIAWELATSTRLFPLGNDPSTLLAIVSDEPPHASSVVETLPPALDDVIATALVRDAKLRCASADAFARAIEAACAASGIELASRADVSATVRRFCGPELDDRKAKADSARAKMRPIRQVSRPTFTATLLNQPPQIKTIPLPKVPLEPTAEEHGLRGQTEQLPLAPLLHDPSTFAPASGIIDRDLLFAHRTRWAWAAAGASVLAVMALVITLVQDPAAPVDSDEVASDASDPSLAAVPAARTLPDSTALAVSDASSASSGSVTPFDDDVASSPSLSTSRLSTASPSTSGTVPASRPAMPRSMRPRSPKLVQDDPYQRKL